MRKNVLFIVIDSVTNDVIFNKETSNKCAPFLRKLRKEAISGDKMYAQAPYTEAALMSLLGSINTMDNGGYMERFKGKTCVLDAFKNAGYKVFYENYYPSIYPSYIVTGFDEKMYIEGFQFSHIWEYRLKYFSEVFDNNDISNQEYEMLISMLKDNFESWLIYLEKIKNNDKETVMLNHNIDITGIDESIEQLEKQYDLFKIDPKKYLEEIFIKKEAHPLFSIKTYLMSDKIHDDEFKKKVITNYKYLFDKINKLDFKRNLFNNRFPIKKMVRSVVKKDFKTIKGLLAGYKNSLFDKDLYERISMNYDTFKVQRSFYTVSQELYRWIENNKDKEWMAYVHVDDAHFNENFFSYDTKDWDVVKSDFERISKYLNELPKKYKGSITYDLSLLYCDNIIKNIFAFLEKKQLLDNTSVVITADHGFSYYFSPIREKYVISSYRENYNVPFIIWDKSIEPKMIHNYCSTKDIPATLLDVVKIDIPKQFKGHSLLSYDGTSYAFLEYMGGGCPDIKRRPVILGVRTDDYDVIMELYLNKPFRDNEIKEVYNIKKDRYEQNNLANKNNIRSYIQKELNLIESRFNELVNEYEVV